MKLTEYLSSGAGSSELARRIQVSPAVIYQWRTGKRPVPVERCLAIEIATEGKVTRRDLRPTDYWEIWPDLKRPELAHIQQQEEVAHD